MFVNLKVTRFVHETLTTWSSLPVSKAGRLAKERSSRCARYETMMAEPNHITENQRRKILASNLIGISVKWRSVTQAGCQWLKIVLPLLNSFDSH